MSHTLYVRRLPEVRLPGKPLGRHVLHDSRSRDFAEQPVRDPQSVSWRRNSPILDQGDLGSCTGNASDGVLGSDPFTIALPSGFDYSEAAAVKIYGLATQLDSYPGTYPPNDTGSDGVSAAKACQRLGWISGYTHALSFDSFLAGMQKGPAITGISWLTGCDSPDSRGLVHYVGSVRGGHEIEVTGVDIANQVVWFANSWGTSWGKDGTFCMSFADYQRALADDGDATFFTPLNVPAPTPTPTPTPVPGDAALLEFLATKVQHLGKSHGIVDWANASHVDWNKQAAAAVAKLILAES